MRDKLRKRIALSAVTALTLFAAVPVYADTYDAVYDDAALLSDEEQQSLSEEITNLQETTGWEIFVLTTEDAQGKTAREYADDFYDTTATGDDGVVFLIDMDNREVTISTAGEAIYYLNDDRIDEEQQSLSEEITNLQETTGWEIFVLTTEDAQGKTAREYADDFYDTTATGDDGVVFLIDMDNREVTISTAGEAIYYLNDDRIDDILDNCYDYVVDGEYASCFSSMLSDAEYYYEVGVPFDAYTYDEETGEIHYYHVLTMGEILFAVVLAAAVFAAVFFGITGKYRLKFGGGYQYDYHAFGKVNLTGQEDRFVNQMVTHRRIQTDSGSSGGGSSHSGRSTVHTSSSGRSHGGGSRKF